MEAFRCKLKPREFFSFFIILTIPLLSRSLCTDLRVPRPLILPHYPENATAVVGGQVKLLCKVHRPAFTKVQWLKRDGDRLGAEGQPHLRVLTALQSNISKVNSLSLSNVSLEDTGEYICMAETTTQAGHQLQSMQSAWLQVLPGKPEFINQAMGCFSHRIRN